MVSSVTDKLSNLGTDSEFIVAGYTSKLQAMDVGVNRPFKVKLAEKFDEFLQNRADNAKPSRQDIAYWVKYAWDNIEEQGIRNTWRHIGIQKI